MPGIVTRASLESHASKIGAGPDGMGYVWALLIGILQMLLELFANGVFFAETTGKKCLDSADNWR